MSETTTPEVLTPTTVVVDADDLERRVLERIADDAIMADLKRGLVQATKERAERDERLKLQRLVARSELHQAQRDGSAARVREKQARDKMAKFALAASLKTDSIRRVERRMKIREHAIRRLVMAKLGWELKRDLRKRLRL